MFKKIHNFFHGIYCNCTFRQFVKYGVIGSSTVFIDIGLTTILTEFFGFWYLVSSIAAQMVAVIFNFSMNRRWSFQSGGMVGRQMAKYVTLLIFNYFYSIGALYFFVEVCHLHYLIGKIIIAMTMVSWNFLLFKYVIYK